MVQFAEQLHQPLTQINPQSPTSPLSCNEDEWKYVYICVNALVMER